MRIAIGKWLAVTALVTLGSVTGLGGCSQQAEGERCSTLNGNDDCSDGFECAPASDFQGQSNADLCCPPKGQSASSSLCQIRNGQAPFDAAPPAVDSSADTSAADASVAPDAAGPDASVAPDAASVDAASAADAIADAPSDGG